VELVERAHVNRAASGGPVCRVLWPGSWRCAR
jgi:hypothetical protein